MNEDENTLKHTTTTTKDSILRLWGYIEWENWNENMRCWFPVGFVRLGWFVVTFHRLPPDELQNPSHMQMYVCVCVCLFASRFTEWDEHGSRELWSNVIDVLDGVAVELAGDGFGITTYIFLRCRTTTNEIDCADLFTCYRERSSSHIIIVYIWIYKHIQTRNT